MKSEEQIEAMAAAGTLAIPYLAPRFEYSPLVAAACVRALLQIGSEAALNALLAYTADDTPDVIEALILGLREVTDKPAYAQRFLSHVKHVSGSPATLKLLPFLPHLSDLSLSHLPQVSDLSILERLPALASLELYDLPQVSDLSVLERLDELKSITVGRLAQGCVFPQGVLKRVRITRLT